MIQVYVKDSIRPATGWNRYLHLDLIVLGLLSAFNHILGIDYDWPETQQTLFL